MKSVFLELSVLSCLILGANAQNFQYFYSLPNNDFAPIVPVEYPQLYQPHAFRSSSQSYDNQLSASPEHQFKMPGAHVQPAPPFFYESYHHAVPQSPLFKMPGAHVQPAPPSFYEAAQQVSSQPPSFKIPGAHVQPAPPYIYQQSLHALPHSSQFKMPGAHVQPAPPSFYQSPMQDPIIHDKYRGFSYHVDYDDGAKSSVVFFRGGIEYNITSPNRITVASDSLDPQEARNIGENIQKALDQQNSVVFRNQPNVFQTLQPAVSAILSDPLSKPGIVHFYEGEPGLPASTNFLNLPVLNQKDQVSEIAMSEPTHQVPDDESVSVEAASDSRSAKSLDIADHEDKMKEQDDSSADFRTTTQEIALQNSTSTVASDISSTTEDSNATIAALTSGTPADAIIAEIINITATPDADTTSESSTFTIAENVTQSS